jgi:hypothetical protein
VDDRAAFGDHGRVAHRRGDFAAMVAEAGHTAEICRLVSALRRRGWFRGRVEVGELTRGFGSECAERGGSQLRVGEADMPAEREDDKFCCVLEREGLRAARRLVEAPELGRGRLRAEAMKRLLRPLANGSQRLDLDAAFAHQLLISLPSGRTGGGTRVRQRRLLRLLCAGSES